MAETFEAVRRGPGGFVQRVCLKLVQPFFRDKPDFLELFEREARLAAQLRHSNIVGVIDFGRIEGVTYMALELVDGIDLATLLEAQPGRCLSAEHVALLGQELSQALEHAHDPRRDTAAGGADKTIIHRDISPSNIMVSCRGEVLLTDFGVAKAITGTAHQQSAVKGKVPYMSPEQLRAEPLDGRADLFALGVVLFEALCGRRPFQGEHDPATIMKILRGERPSLRALASEAPAGLCDVIESLLETDPDKRPPSATALLERLDPFVPPPRERRVLGAMASEVKASRPEPTQPGDTNEASGVSRTSGPLLPSQPPADSSTKSGSGRRWLSLWVLVALVAIGALFPLWPLGAGETPDPPTTEATTATTPTTTSKVPEEPVQAELPPEDAHEADAVQEDEQESETADRKATTIDTADALGDSKDRTVVQARPSRLDVFVFPWGHVWINGAPYGTAPLKSVSLKPGRYKISVGRDAPSKTKIVRLRPGDRKTLQFDLTQ